MNGRGRKLHKLSIEEHFNVEGPMEPTHIHAPTNTRDVLDIAILKNISQELELNVHYELSSDHLPIFTTLTTGTEEKENKTTFINWSKFKNELKIREEQINNEEDLEKAVNTLQKEIKDAMEKATTTTTKIKNKQTLPQEILSLIKKKNKAKKQYARTLYPRHKAELNRLTNEVKAAVTEYGNQKWEKF